MNTYLNKGCPNSEFFDKDHPLRFANRLFRLPKKSKLALWFPKWVKLDLSLLLLSSWVRTRRYESESGVSFKGNLASTTELEVTEGLINLSQAINHAPTKVKTSARYCSSVHTAVTSLQLRCFVWLSSKS
ncbi:hypothetical protein V9T40_012253 [Parthenolecanium corni]|uniref:Uncharacterized protein n=1 Tax=Parthenolecanium corni TaxID=536013 RepID=A0AAN9TK41_9HEMI